MSLKDFQIIAKLGSIINFSIKIIKNNSYLKL